ncbi:septum formation family protein [Streptomyces sp. NPDC053755]|uniref:septum formation family protein n=1 Tax=Streptomyces sp. NPDC053755 TaxID=3155815 RepID=UPI00341421D1
MAPFSADPSSPLRYLLLPVLLVLAAALVAAALVAGRDAGGETTPEGPAAGTADAAGGTTRTTQAGAQQPAPQGQIAGRRPSSAPATPSASLRPSPTASPASAAPSAAPAAPSASARPVRRREPAPSALSYDRLRAGECFDIDRSAPGTVTRRACDRPHDAQLVTVLRLTGDLPSDQDVRDAAARLCREPLRRKAAEQPLGTRWTTFVQYPYRTSYLLGSDTVACSLAAHTDDDTPERDRKLTAPLL